jgi:predicted transcriptional regulator
MIKEYLNSILTQDFPGPHISFTVYDIIKAIDLIAKEGPIGRVKLSQKLKLGEGEIRTLLKKMKRSMLIKTSKAGCSLTQKGIDLWKNITKSIPKKVILDKNELTKTEYSIAVLVRNVKEKIRKGIEQRDIAVRAGADGATTILIEDENLIIPSVSSDLSNDYPEAFRQISQSMQPASEDGIIVVYAKSLSKAENGVLAVAWSLID